MVSRSWCSSTTPSDPVLRLGEWLTEAGRRAASMLRLHAGDPIPEELDGYQALISLGGEMGAVDDDVAPWLPATKALLRRGRRGRTRPWASASAPSCWPPPPAARCGPARTARRSAPT